MACAYAFASATQSTEIIVFRYGSGDSGDTYVSVHVPKQILMSFRLINDANNDCSGAEDNSFCANVPTVYDAKHTKILFNEQELELFFELAANEQLTIHDLETRAIDAGLLKRFLLLVNFLDNEKYLNILCQFAAHLIKSGAFTLS
jgi:hypothetical protein